MERQEYEWLRSGIGALDELLAMTPEEAVIDRMSLESEREKIVAKLAGFTPPARWPATAWLTLYDSNHVKGRRNLDVAFALKAVTQYSDAVAAAGASLAGPLPKRGPIPNRDDYRLLVSTVSARAFGFKLEEANPPDGADPTFTERGIGQIHALLKAMASTDGDGENHSNGNGDDYDSAIAATHPRVLADLSVFLQTLVDNDAVCGLARNKGDFFRFWDTAELRRGLSVLQLTDAA